MSDKVFLDSNILIYSYSNDEQVKQGIARKLITESSTVISTQVLQELVNTVTRKFKFAYSQAQAAVVECCGNSDLHVNTDNTILQACRIAEKYSFSFYDSLVISAALESGCKTLYSEDMQHNQMIDQMLTIVNPFL